MASSNVLKLPFVLVTPDQPVKVTAELGIRRLVEAGLISTVSQLSIDRNGTCVPMVTSTKDYHVIGDYRRDQAVMVRWQLVTKVSYTLAGEDVEEALADAQSIIMDREAKLENNAIPVLKNVFVHWNCENTRPVAYQVTWQGAWMNPTYYEVPDSEVDPDADAFDWLRTCMAQMTVAH